jgi:hypothetical protein
VSCLVAESMSGAATWRLPRPAGTNFQISCRRSQGVA